MDGNAWQTDENKPQTSDKSKVWWSLSSLGLETENNLLSDRIRINFRVGQGLKWGIRKRQGFRLQFKEWMLSVEVLWSVLRQLYLFGWVYVCFTEEEETAHQKAGKPSRLSKKILCEIWDFWMGHLSDFTVNVVNREPRNTFSFKVHTRKTLRLRASFSN